LTGEIRQRPRHKAPKSARQQPLVKNFSLRILGPSNRPRQARRATSGVDQGTKQKRISKSEFPSPSFQVVA
jgi:hypothetical protein